MKKLVVIALLFLFLCMGIKTTASAIEFPEPLTNAVAYGDFYSYSLPLLAWQYDALYGGGTGPGNPYYVSGTAGHIAPFTVLGVGSAGQPVTNNYDGADDAYPLPEGAGGVFYDDPDTFFSTNDHDVYDGDYLPIDGVTSIDVGVLDPQESGTYDPDDLTTFTPDFTGDTPNTWDVLLTALAEGLGTDAEGNVNDMFVFFRNNQVDSGDPLDPNQNLYGWAMFSLVDNDGVLDPLDFEFTNPLYDDGDPYHFLFTEDNDVTKFDADGLNYDWSTREDPGEYVLSGGPLYLIFDGDGNLVAIWPITAAYGNLELLPDGYSYELLEHNLGDNQAAYAIFSPELQAVLEMEDFGGYDTLQVYYRFADLNNGDEAIWIMAGEVGDFEEPVPEPGTMLLLGSGLVGLAAIGRRKFRWKKQ